MSTASDAPLSLYQLLDPEVRANPYPFYHRLRSEDPVHWDPYFNAWIVTRYEDVITVLTQYSAQCTPPPEFFEASGVPDATPIANLLVKQMLFQDAPAHTRLRSLTGAFMPARVQLLRDHIGDIATKLIDDIESRGTGRMDLLAEFAEPLPAIVTAEMLGVPSEDHAKLKRWSATFAEILGNFQHTDRLGGVLWAAESLSAYFQDAIREQREDPRDGLVRQLMTAELAGDRLTDDEVVANCIITLVGGLETTTNLIANGMLSLLSNPDQLMLLRHDERIMPSAVEELLRYESPSQQTARLAPRDEMLGGKRIHKRDAVVAMMAAANRDPHRFADPDRLDLDRADNRHVAFGWGAHFCFGAPLARLEAHIAFETLLRRFPVLELTSDKLAWRENLGLRGLESLPLFYSSKR